MNSIKFLIGVAVIALTLAGFISMDPAFKSSFKTTYGVHRLSATTEHLNPEHSVTARDNIALNLAH